QRRERANRQINERLKVLIAAYKVLGGSFTGTLTVDPTHMRDLRGAELAPLAEGEPAGAPRSERAARELVAGRHVHTHELVLSLRDFIREALDLAPVPRDLAIPMQGPTRPQASGRSRGEGGQGEGGRSRGGGGGGGGAAMGGGVGLGLVAGAGPDVDPAADKRS
ncbi:MAG TPA: hypothetical protein VFN28_10370, partial [Amaricoccus sp.]|nr:hypothetical protein [Amaricoccus sp.]